MATTIFCPTQLRSTYNINGSNAVGTPARFSHYRTRILSLRGVSHGFYFGYHRHSIQEKKKKRGKRLFVLASNDSGKDDGEPQAIELYGQIERGFLVIATPFASGFDHLRIADEVQFKFDRCLRSLGDDVRDLPTFGLGHSLGTVIHLLIGARYAVQRSGNVFISFNNKEASVAIPLFSPVIVPMAQSFGPVLGQLTSSPTIRRGAEIAMKQLENLSPPLLKQVLPLVEQLPPLYMDLVKGREDFMPRPEETRRLIKSYYGIGRNLLVKFKDDTIDETPVLAQALSFESAVSSYLDMSVRTLPGDHGLPLQQILPEVPPAMADAVTRGGEILANLAAGTPWETVAKEVGISLGADTGLRQQIIQDIDRLVDEIAAWMISSFKLLP